MLAGLSFLVEVLDALESEGLEFARVKLGRVWNIEIKKTNLFRWKYGKSGQTKKG